MVMQMTYVYSQIIFVLTHSQLTRIFEQRINYDLRRMLTGETCRCGAPRPVHTQHSTTTTHPLFQKTGTEKFLDSLLDLLDRNPSFFLSAVRCLPMPGSIRDKIGQTLQQARIKVCVFAPPASSTVFMVLTPLPPSLPPRTWCLLC